MLRKYQITLLVTLMALSTSLSAFANRGGLNSMWKRRRAAAINFIDYRSKLSTPTGQALYTRSSTTRWGAKNMVQLGLGTPNDPLSVWEADCNVLNGFPKEDCLRFSPFLTHASSLYISWLFAHGLSVYLSRDKARAALKGMSKDKREKFVALLPKMLEVEQMAWIYAMKHWNDVLAMWPFLSRNISGLGQPKEQDYARDFSTRFSTVARKNRASLNAFQVNFGMGKDRFLRFVTGRFTALNGTPLLLSDYTEGEYAPAAKAILKEFKEVLDSL